LGRDEPPDEAYRRVLEVLPSGWQYPEITQPTLEIQGRMYRPAGFRETPWVQRARIRADQEPVG
ncbi:MAG: hypothetical protein GWM90_31290, partial [Gemmatimonadetes bacterium]|nr:hypothetical protein [Gemmatimonadota bacterium]NIQ59698.1 hypothetical protein [Gemmatimonadota bacterium]NIU79901.1 hypothetical protein [Gammaproteobacteria bacterium]NIX48383.1 hypothetical protein [Gemmatimonadota bacterium]NIY12823.1 hypothetical protein [Gemmatimonadota bacterium]